MEMNNTYVDPKGDIELVRKFANLIRDMDSSWKKSKSKVGVRFVKVRRSPFRMINALNF